MQHTAWMLTNLLARSAQFVVELRLDCPPVPLARRVVPGPLAADTLAETLLRGAAAVSPEAVPASTSQSPSDAPAALRLTLGPGDASIGGWRAHGSGWAGAVSTTAIPEDADLDSELPIGPYIAACLAAAVVCFDARVPGWIPTDMSVSAWDLSASDSATIGGRKGPSRLDQLELDLVLAGVGAVGNAFLHTLWATEDLFGRIRAFDPDIVDPTNLNRAVLFFWEHVERPKAFVAEQLLGGIPLHVTGRSESAEGRIDATTHVISAVDPESRDAIQRRYPCSLIQASTHDFRAELLRCDPRVDTPCIFCYHTVTDSTETDEDVRLRLSPLTDETRGEMMTEVGGTAEHLTEWITRGTCSEVVDRLLAKIRLRPQEHRFAVGFVSALAGSLLAAQAIKDGLVRSGALEPGVVPLSGDMARARYPMLQIGGPVAGPTRYGRDTNCSACDPSTPAGQIWRKRFTG